MGCTVTASMLRNEQAYTMMTLLEQKPSDMLLPTVSAPTGTLCKLSHNDNRDCFNTQPFCVYLIDIMDG